MNLYQSLFLLNNYSETINYLTAIMQEYSLTTLNPDDAEEALQQHYIALFKNVIMESCCFLEEYNDNFYRLVEQEYKERVQLSRTIAKPILDKIKEWKDLQKIRNEMFAHPWRAKGNQFSYTKIFAYKAPRNFFELLALKTYIMLINTIVRQEFLVEWRATIEYMQSISPSRTPPPATIDIFTEVRNVINQSNINLKKQGKLYTFDAEAIMGF
jgi:hypothetical protein